MTPLGVELRTAVADATARLEFAVHAIASVADALAGLHAIEVFHRDIKPDNILIIDGRPVMSDFGLVDFPGKAVLTGGDEFLGPLFYLAPEMMKNAVMADAGKADVYSLAKTLWVAVTGQTYPLPGEQRVDVPALTLCAYVNEDRCRSLDRLQEAATRQDPSARPNMRTFADELEAWTHPLQLEAPISVRLTEIAKIYHPMLKGLERAQRRREQCYGDLEELTSRIRTRMESLAADLAGMNLRGPTGAVVPPQLTVSGGEPSLWYDWPDAPRPIAEGSLRTSSVYVSQHLPGLNGRSVAYCGGFRLSLVEEARFRVGAAHAFGSANSDARTFSECTWKNEFVVQSGMPLAIQRTDELLEQFATELPVAITGMLRLLEKIGQVRSA